MARQPALLLLLLLLLLVEARLIGDVETDKDFGNHTHTDPTHWPGWLAGRQGCGERAIGRFGEMGRADPITIRSQRLISLVSRERERGNVAHPSRYY